MKKFNFLLLFSLLFYMALSFFIFHAFSRIDRTSSLDYKIEINRFIRQLEDGKKDLTSYPHLKKVSFLERKEENKEKVSVFFKEEENTHIEPWYQGDELKGYVKIFYGREDSSLHSIFFIEFLLFLFFIIFIGILVYIKRNIIRPFHTIASLPKELAKGHFKGEIKVEKSRYFKEFLWGMSALKDTLETQHQNELVLLKERQKWLLSLSHDIKTPLNTIALYEKALEEGFYETETERKKALHQISLKIKETQNYIEEITKSSREELLDLPVQMGEFYLKDLMNRIEKIYEEKCAYHHIEWSISSYNNSLLKGDIDRSQEVLENILENAFKYGDGKKIWITFSEEEYCTLIHIHNTGVVLSENEWNHLFDSFFRGTNTEGKKGSGLGLYICQELMRKMEGSIYAVKEKGGMCFVMVFK